MTTFTTEDRINATKVEQGTDEWKRLRLGHVTASNVADVMAKGKTGEAITRYKYKVRIVAERMTGASPESYTNSAMEWGIEQERFACMAYEERNGVFLDKTGFWLHPTIEWLGVSPDRLVGEDGLVEVKCPNTTTHLDYIFANKVPSEYYKQIQCQLWVTNRTWCDFISFDPRLPKRNQLFVVRCNRDDSLIAEMEVEVKQFLSEVQDLIIKLGE
jgi:putative phage-type endonuclease